MKSILEQNFEELYAQVEERVKCIQPVKQINTFTKISMWISLNEILIDIFGESRFMYLICDRIDRKGFVVEFVDRYKQIACCDLLIPYTITFIWPEIDQIKNMSYEELVRFEHEVVTTCGFKQQDICSHYNQNFNWFSAMKSRRKNGAVPSALKSEYRLRRMIELQRQLAVSRIDKWTDAEIRAFKFVYALDKYSLPKNTRLINLVLGTTIKAHTNYGFSRMLKTGSPTINRFITDTTITEMYDDVVVYVDKLIDLANEILNGCRSRFTRFIFIELGISQPPRHTLTRDAYVKLHNFIVRLNNIRGGRK